MFVIERSSSLFNQILHSRKLNFFIDFTDLTMADSEHIETPEVVEEKAPNTNFRSQAVYEKFMGLVDRDDWKKGPIVEGCQIETAPVTYCKFDAVRIGTTFNCSLETLRDFLKEEVNVRKYDVTLETFEVVEASAESAVLYTAYKKESRLVDPRDFVTETANQIVSKEIALEQKLTTKEDNTGAFIQSSISIEGKKPAVKGWVRGTIHAYGFLAIAEGPKKIYVYNYACVDPSGSIPKMVADATTSQSAKTLAKIRSLCEEMEAHSNLSAAALELRANPLYTKFLELVDRRDWKKGSVVEGCLIETCSVPYTTLNAVRIGTTFNCSLETLRDFLKEEENVRKYDVSLETFEVLKTNPDSAVLYTNYKKESRLVAPRDFVTETTNKLVTKENGLELGLTRLTDNAGVFIQTSVSVDGVKEPTKDWVRGTIHAYGFLAVAEGPKKIQVYNYACVDPSGNIPKMVADATASLSAKTLAKIRSLCEAAQK